MNVCKKCGKEFKTGHDDIKPEDNEYTNIELTLHMSGGYKSRLVEEKSIDYNELCPTCGRKLFDELNKHATRYIWGEPKNV